ncbi:DUF31 family protein [Mycoplasmopsis cynos]|uniref:DUF31 family putative serine protease n=1 Tax=Mycoplasmopsis cynos TaxID=171284 RepID=UPI0024C8CC92|nr:hypothetical protein [Mycoplasmopsis cynos]WAM06706.1 DUF31 family protein [Mycoplasmopsis cynos]
MIEVFHYSVRNSNNKTRVLPPPFQSSTKVSGTAWIIDRIKSPLKNKSNKKEYEFLVATNARIASLNHIFDRKI